MIKKIINKIKYRYLCYWCLNEKKYRLGIKYGRYVVDAEPDEHNNAMPIYGNVNLCVRHFADYMNREGIWDEYKYR